MFGKLLKVALAAMLFSLATARADAPQDSAARRAEKVRAKVSKLGEGPRVEVKLADKTKLKGRVAESDGEGFMLVDEKGGRTRAAYSQVASVNRVRNSSGAKDLTIFGAVMGGIFAYVAWALRQSE